MPINDQAKKLLRIKDIGLMKYGRLLNVIAKKNSLKSEEIVPSKSRRMGMVSKLSFFISVFSLDIVINIGLQMQSFYDHWKWIPWTAILFLLSTFLFAIFAAIMESKLRPTELHIPAVVIIIKYARINCFYSAIYLVISPIILTQLQAAAFLLNDQDLPGIRFVGLFCVVSGLVMFYLERNCEKKIIAWLSINIWE